MALDVGPGDEVILPTFTFFATAGVVSRLGATPVFVDIDPVDYNIDPSAVRDRVSDRTKAIIPVHLFGQSADIAAISEAAGDVPIIEDCAQAWGADFGGRYVGGHGLMGAFSFFPSKNLGGFGDGGLVTTNDAELAAKLRELRVHGQSGPYLHPIVGGNFRLDAIQAAVLRVKLPHVQGWIQGRRANAMRYVDLFTQKGLDQVLGCRPRCRAAATPSTSSWFVHPTATSFASISASARSAVRSTTRFPSTSSRVSASSGSARATVRWRSRRAQKFWPCRSSPNSPRTRSHEVVDAIAEFYDR